MRSLILFGDSMFGRFGRDSILKLEAELGDVLVYNCATGGFNTEDGLKHAPFMATLKPDYICLSFGANDNGSVPERLVSLDKFKDNLIEIVHIFRLANPTIQIIFFPCPPANDPADPTGTADFNKMLEKYNAVAIDVCNSLDACVLNSADDYGKLLQKGENYHASDGLHLNEVGYSVLIGELKRAISAPNVISAIEDKSLVGREGIGMNDASN